MLRIVPYAALHYMTYEQYRCLILNNCSALGTGPIVDLLAGSAAGGTAVLCTYPLDLARTKLAYQVIHQFIFDVLTTYNIFLYCLFPSIIQACHGIFVIRRNYFLLYCLIDVSESFVW